MATATSGCDRRRGVTTIGSRSTLRRVSGLRWRPKNGRAAHMPSPRMRSEMAMREDIDPRFAFARRGHVRNDRCGWQRDHVRPRAWVRRSAVHRPGSGDRRTDGNFPIRMWAATGPSRVLIALNNISTPRNQQYERAKEHKCNDRVKTSKPGDAMTKRKMDG